MRYKNELLGALLKETELQRDYFTPPATPLLFEESGLMETNIIETIYFGGGTPSLLSVSELKLQIDKLRNTFTISDNAEVTLEANPDDITEEKLIAWKETGISRLSIGIQSFFEEDLRWMNRAHNSQQAIDNLHLAIQHFDNITIDLIYGHPLLTNEKWQQNVDRIIRLNIPHISCYALTVEPKTPLQKLIKEKKKDDVQPEKQAEQFLLLMDWLGTAGYEHYEISNFAKPGFRSKHNTSYWQGKKYLGLGPSAHSFNGESRQWNVSNNKLYIGSLEENRIPFEKEILTSTQKINEYIMTSLRTAKGLDLAKVENSDLKVQSQKFIDEGKMILIENRLILTKEGKLFADGIAAELFIS